MNTNITIYNNLGKMHREMGAYDLALAYYDSVYVLSAERGHLDGMEVELANQAQLYARPHGLTCLCTAEKSSNLSRCQWSRGYN